MLRKLFLFLVLLGFAGAMVYSYFHFKAIKQPVSNSIKAIPTNAALVIESRQITSSWKKLSETNLIWQELLNTAQVTEVNQSLLHLDSLQKSDKHFGDFLKTQPVFVSAHMSGANNFNFLFTIGIPPSIDIEDVEKYIKKVTTTSTIQSKTYDGVNITTVRNPTSKSSFHYAVHNGIFSCSFSMILVEDAIRQLQAQRSLLDITDFNKVLQTAGDKIDANVYLNYKVFPNIISSIIAPGYQKELDAITNIANWAEVDLELVPNAIKLNGYTYANDSVSNYLNAWTNQEPQSPEMINILPKNISTFMHMGYSDFDLFRKNYQTYLEKNNRLFEYGAAIKLVETKYSLNFTEQFLEHIDDELALAIAESGAENYKNAAFAIFKMKDIEKALANITVIDTLIDNAKEISRDTITYKGYAIQQINLAGMMKILFGAPFSVVTENYYTSIGDYLIFGNSINNMRDFINYYERGRTLARDEHFSAFMDNLNDKSNVLVYSNIATSHDMFKAFVSNETAQDIEQHSAVLDKFEGIAIQFSKNKNNLYYNNIYINHNPIEKKETSSLWATQLNAPITRKPQLVKNHNTSEKEIFIQDDNNVIYLISNTGEILWQRELPGKILGEAAQIDIYKNEKLQLLFNTDSLVYLIDRNGKNVTGYPIRLESASSAPLAAMDYDKNRNYRILVPTKDGNVINFEASGKKVKGWAYENTKTPIIHAFQHVLLQGKDYIISVDVNGNIHALNRKGEERLNLVSTTDTRPFKLIEGESIRDTYLATRDSAGVTTVYLDDVIERTKLPDLSIASKVTYADINTDNLYDYIITTENELIAIDTSFSEICAFETDSTISSQVYTYELSSESIEMGFASKNANEIYLINKLGDLHEGFPLYGSTPFTIGDLNKDGQYELIVGSKDGHIYAYGL